MHHGPCSYAPQVEEEVVEERKAIILENQGIYVRDLEKGDVKIIKNQTYMLKAHEVLAEKVLDERIEKLIDPSGTRDKTKAVTITIEHNEAIHIYKEKDNSSRVVLGPNVVMLEYDEHVTVNILSGKTPKEEGVIKTLKIRLGPDFMSDIFKVETSNSAKLKVAISCNWHFKIDKDDQESLKKIFNVRDFVGDTCRELKSKIVAEVASRTLDEFHKNSAKIIRTAIFGVKDGKVNDEYFFPANNLCITNCDIKSVESLDKESQQSLREIVNMAIQITTDMSEANAKAQAAKEQQEAEAQIQKQKNEDERQSEKFRKELYEYQNQTKVIQKSGIAIAEQRAKAEADRILSDAQIEIAEVKAKIATINQECDLEYTNKKREIQHNYDSNLKTLMITKEKELSEIESGKFEKTVNAIGKETIIDIANAGPELQAKLLEGLGLSGYLMMDSNNPVNLFNAAEGFVRPGFQ